MTLELPHHDTYTMTRRVTSSSIDDLRNSAEEFFGGLFDTELNFKFWRTWPLGRVKIDDAHGVRVYTQKWACEVANHIHEAIAVDEQELREYCIEHDLPYVGHSDSLKAYAVHRLGKQWNAPVETKWEFTEKEHPLSGDRKVLHVHAAISDASL